MNFELRKMKGFLPGTHLGEMSSPSCLKDFNNHGRKPVRQNWSQLDTSQGDFSPHPLSQKARFLAAGAVPGCAEWRRELL